MSMNHQNPSPTAGPVADTAARPENTRTIGTKATLIGGIVSGITASACCAGPFVLLSLGISGGWISNFSALEPFRPLFIVIAAVFIGLAYRKVYRAPQTCDADAVCATPQGQRTQRIAFWIVSLVTVAAIAFPWYGPWLLD